MITREFAEAFTQEWLAAWNSHDLKRVLAHYSDDFEMRSPLIPQIVGKSSGRLKGKAAVSAYWAVALGQMPGLKFEWHSTLVGADSLVIYYRGAREMVAEWFAFDPHGKVISSSAHYAEPI